MTYFDVNRLTETLIPACKSVLTDPRNTFEQMPRTGFYKNGFALLSLITLAASIISVPFIGFVMIFMLPFVWGMIMFSVWIWASYLSWAVRTFGKQKLNTINAFQLSAYASVPMVAGFIPFAGLLAGLWNLYLTWVALVANAKVQKGTALVIILIPVVLLGISFGALVDLVLQLVPQLRNYIHL